MTITPGVRLNGAQRAKRWAQKYPEKQKEVKRKTNLKNKYGLTVEEYDTRLLDQSNGCAICGKPERTKRLAVDHCHGTNAIRGLLCTNCNIGLGRFQDDPSIIRNALLYLEGSDE